MLLVLNIPSLLSPPCPCLPVTFSLQLQSNGTRHIITPWGVINNTFPITVSLPVPLPFPLPVLCRLPFPLPILCSLPIPGPLLAALRVLLTLTVVIVIVIARMAPSTARRTWIRPFLITNIIVDYLIPTQWSNGQEVAWFVPRVAWRLNLGPEIIATVSRETLAGEFNLSRSGCLQIGAIDLIPEGLEVVPPPIVHLVVGFVKHLPHI